MIITLQVSELRQQHEAAWDAFVDAHPHGSPFHLLAWKRVMEASFGYAPQYLIAEEDGRVRAVLPLFLIENPLIGKALISSPFAVYGGILADSDEARDAMAEAVAALGKRLGVEYVELRNGFPEQRAGFAPVSRYVTFTQETTIAEPEALLAALPKKTRNMVRKSLKFEYSARHASGLSAFYRLMCRSYRRLGTPVFPRKYFEKLQQEFGDRVDVREIVLNDRVVAASFNFLCRSEMHTYYAASDPDFLHAAPNNYMYFNHLLWAAEKGFRRFDFGRSKLDTGTFEFKRHWLTEMRELPYEVLLVKRKGMPNFTPKNPKFELALKVWQRLPLPLTKVLGPRLVRLFP